MMRKAVWTKLLAISVVGGITAGCAQTELAVHTAKTLTPAPSTKSTGNYKVGNPYQIRGVWYYPAVDYNYDETGIASWYGPGFHGKQTANGEIFNQNDITAAHRTLPMPSLVRVTNLENGRSIVVRINDRGPFAHGRIIDLSRRSAQLLGFEQQGTAKVRVQILAEESRLMAQGQDPGTPAPSAAPRVTVAAETLPPPGSNERPQPVVHTPPPERLSPPPAPEMVLENQTVLQGTPVNTQVYVQAGAFSLYDNANRLSAQLSGLGMAQISTVHVNGSELYRVRLGPFASVEEADRLLATVIHSGYTDARIIVD
ncbi:septal ring lytic transglycosylase RlpA family protein [Telmatospirillum sp. J64-1]|uniref:septal ring lytic transglycosylase RlpA family protein n=1 Tax=Telmatospirillum sp. J64-1 TaxID=2502183 RepID=UPI00115F04EA|nr:septal ring lytic transglycosylase RlpA family protein [Telmatospirillum sp. J64-1]